MPMSCGNLKYAEGDVNEMVMLAVGCMSSSLHLSRLCQVNRRCIPYIMKYALDNDQTQVHQNLSLNLHSLNLRKLTCCISTPFGRAHFAPPCLVISSSLCEGELPKQVIYFIHLSTAHLMELN